MKKHFFTFSFLLLSSLLAAQDQKLVVVSQTGTENEAELIQENAFGMEVNGSLLYLVQHGDRNNSFVEQRGLDNHSEIFQEGRENRLSSNGLYDNTEAQISQVGLEN